MFATMFKLFSNQMKPYKIQDVSRRNRIGIVARDLKDVIQKGKLKLKIPKEDEVSVVIADDGTVVDSDAFLVTLPSQTKLVLLRQGETWNGAGGLIYQAINGFYNATNKFEVAKQIRELLTDENAPEKLSIMAQYLDMLEMDVESEMRYEHEDWFAGVSPKYNTKGEVLISTAQQRIRSYYTSAKEMIEKETGPKVKAVLSELLEELYEKLKKNHFHGHYFDRSAAAKLRICDKNGWFKCEGAFDEECCSKFHTINPYASKGYRLLFGLWNLDHIIEKSRKVIPSLLEAARNMRKSSQLNTEEVYKLLFTRANLKLVQIGCHRKTARAQNTLNVERFYLS